MDNSIFYALTSYTPTLYIDPQENFLTELFAWTLNYVPGFAQKYLDLVNKQVYVDGVSPINDETSISVVTQETVTSGYIDMVIYTDAGVSYICEHKVDSELSDDQIQKYINCSDELRNDDRYCSVLLTKAKWQFAQNADACLTWSEVDGLIESIINDYYDDPANRFVLEQFSKFLKEKGLGRIKPMNAEYMRDSFIREKANVIQMDNQLKRLFNELADLDWKTIIPGIDSFLIDERYKCEYKTKRTGPEWGRVGINFYKNWKPGLFAGVLYDGTDHKLELCDENMGPDLVIVLDIENKLKKEFDSFDWTINMKTRLRKDHAPFIKFVSAPKSAWRLAVLQRPFYDIIKDADTYDEQKERIVEAIKTGVELMIGKGE